MRTYKTVIFDLDGTLLDTLDDLRTAVNLALTDFGWPARTEEQIRLSVGNGVRVLMALSVPDGEENPQFEAALAAFKEHYAVHQFDTTRPYDGILETVRALESDGVQTAVVSNKIDFAVQDLNNRFFHLHVAIGDREGQKRKPAPDSVFAAMKALNADPKTTVYVGDSEVDLKTAENAGLPCICAAWGFRTREELDAAGATVYADKPEDLLTLV